MKKVLSVLLGISLMLTTHSQIQKLDISEPKRIEKIDFDSTINFVGNNSKLLIGQELYLLGIERASGYEGFTIDLKLNTNNKSNVYKPTNKNSLYTKYEEVAEKYFTVLDVLNHPKLDEDKFLYGNVLFLKLKEKTSGDVIYYRYDPSSEFRFPFMIVGYFLKQKEIFLNKEYIIRGRNWNDYGKNSPITDINSGHPVSEFNIGSTWKVVDISIKPAKDYLSFGYGKNLFLILENSIKEKVQLPIDAVSWEWALFEKPIAEKHKEKFGPEVWQKILKGQIWLNMTDEMCKLSIGIPDKVNKTITVNSKSEQWVYRKRVYTTRDQLLYFTDGILTAIQ